MSTRFLSRAKTNGELVHVNKPKVNTLHVAVWYGYRSGDRFCQKRPGTEKINRRYIYYYIDNEDNDTNTIPILKHTNIIRQSLSSEKWRQPPWRMTLKLWHCRATNYVQYLSSSSGFKYTQIVFIAIKISLSSFLSILIYFSPLVYSHSVNVLIRSIQPSFPGSFPRSFSHWFPLQNYSTNYV